VKRLALSAMAFAATVIMVFSPLAWAGDIEYGKEVFNGSAGCHSCHKTTGQKSVGPGLAGNAKLHTDEWQAKWLGDPQKTWEENDAETQDLKKRTGKSGEAKTAMKKRKNLSDEDLKALIAYLKSL